MVHLLDEFMNCATGSEPDSRILLDTYDLCKVVHMLALTIRSQLRERSMRWWLVGFHASDGTQISRRVNLRHSPDVLHSTHPKGWGGNLNDG